MSGDATASDATASDATASDPAGITVYSRPGCPFCITLKMGLKRSHTPFREVNIWNDPDAATFVRSVANGNETVPTVTIGDVSLVNPSAGTVRRLAEEAGLVTATPRRGWFGRRTRQVAP